VLVCSRLVDHISDLMTHLSAPRHGMAYVRQLSFEEGCPLVRRSRFTQLPVQSPSLVICYIHQQTSRKYPTESKFLSAYSISDVKNTYLEHTEGGLKVCQSPNQVIRFGVGKLKHECYKLQVSLPDLAVSSLALLTNLLGAKFTDTNVPSFAISAVSSPVVHPKM